MATRRHDVDTNIERMVAEAKAQDAEEQLEPITLEQLPGNPMYWFILVEPMLPKKTHGVIHLSQETQKVEQIQCTIGRVVAIGPSAFTGKTPAGNDLSLDVDRADVVGQWFMYAKHVGQEIKLRTGHRLILMEDSDLMMRVNDPEEFRHWL